MRARREEGGGQSSIPLASQIAEKVKVKEEESVKEREVERNGREEEKQERGGEEGGGRSSNLLASPHIAAGSPGCCWPKVTIKEQQPEVKDQGSRSRIKDQGSKLKQNNGKFKKRFKQKDKKNPKGLAN